MDLIPAPSLLNLSGKTAIVTGGVKNGIGFGIAHRLAEAGANVVVANLTKSEADEAVADLTSHNWKSLSVQADVSNEDQVKNLVAQTVTTFGGVDILVNNAGIYPNIPVHTMTLPDFQQVISVNLIGVFLCSKYVSDQMLLQDRGGKIINITSIDALHPSSVGLAHYDASKHGVWGFTKNLALELAPHKIWVNAIAPGGILSHGVQKLMGTSNLPEEFLKKIPMHRLGDPDEIGKVALFLASDMSSYMTGSQIVVDGGVLLA